jgi:hypothetical protein
MGFDEKIGDHIPELALKSVTLCITEFVSVDGGDSTNSQRSKDDAIGFLGNSYKG